MRTYLIALAVVLLWASPALAVTCGSINANLSGRPVTAEMNLRLQGKRLLADSSMNGLRGPRRTMTCSPLKQGIYCTQRFGNYTVEITTNGRRLVQTFSNHDTGDAGSIVFRCDGSLHLK
jgi:hypothetical protein